MWVKTKVLLAGVVINWLAAAVLFAILAVVGLPKMLPNQFSVQADTTEVRSPVSIASIVAGSPAAKAGLQIGDQITQLDTTKITAPADLTAATKKHAGKTVQLSYQHNDQTKTTNVTLNTADHAQKGYLGIGPIQDTILRSTWSAPIVGVGLTGQFTYETVKGLGTLLGQVGQGVASKFSSDKTVQQSGGEALSEANQGVAGPVGILFNIFPTFLHAGIVPLVLLTAIISLTLAVMNVLPIPALDGGRLYLTLIFHALKKPLTKGREEKIVGYSFYALILLVIFISFLDVGKIFFK
jgi:regulator of sigma E protease